MSTTLYRLLRWAPRVLGLGVSLFLGLFALDAFGQGKPLAESLPGFLIHLAPAALVLVVVLISWRRAWIGAVIFAMLAVGYAWMAITRLDWILVISGPLFLVGCLFFVSWWMTQSEYRAG
jgi:hypothetical protein